MNIDFQLLRIETRLGEALAMVEELRKELRNGDDKLPDVRGDGDPRGDHDRREDPAGRGGGASVGTGALPDHPEHDAADDRANLRGVRGPEPGGPSGDLRPGEGLTFGAFYRVTSGINYGFVGSYRGMEKVGTKEFATLYGTGLMQVIKHARPEDLEYVVRA